MAMSPTTPTTLTMTPPRRFSLAHAVCSYGYFMLAPNRWVPGRRSGGGELRRPLSLGCGQVLQVRIDQPAAGRLRIRCDRPVARGRHAAVRRQVARMLRLEEDFADWYRRHPEAKRARFACVFRSPTLFEDVVKTITSCNVAWPNTIRMNERLCACCGRDGAFPEPADLAGVRVDVLQRRTRVGYRAERIVRLARDAASGRLDLASFEQDGLSAQTLYEKLRALHGFGDYAANNMLQLLGRYDRVPIDSETIRHFRQTHGARGSVQAITRRARRHYDGFAPYQFLAYWFEQWGPPAQWIRRLQEPSNRT